MKILDIIASALSFFRWLIGFFDQERWMKEGAAAERAKQLQEASDAIDRSTKARERVRADSIRDPSSIVRDDDGFRTD